MGVKLKRIEDQVVVITGASSGIGLATAKMAAERGARVVLVARDPEGLASARVEIEGAGGRAVTVVADVANFEENSPKARCWLFSRMSPKQAMSQKAVAPPLPSTTS